MKLLSSTSIAELRKKEPEHEAAFAKVAEPVLRYMTNDQKMDLISQMEEEMLMLQKIWNLNVQLLYVMKLIN